MNDLTQCLYEFLLDRRMRSLWEDAEYKACLSAAVSLEEQLKSHLSEDQRDQLDRLMDNIQEQGCIERGHQFQAVLGLVRELNALTGA